MRTIRLLISTPTLIILVFGLSFHEASGFLSGKDEDKLRDLPLEIQDERALELIEKAAELRKKKNYGDAIDTYKQIYKKYPSCSFAPEAYYQIGDLHMMRKNYKKAFESYNFAVVRHPDFPKFNEVLEKQFDIAERTMNSKSGRYFSIIKFHNYDAAIQYFETIIGNAPYSEYAPKSLMRVAIMHRTQGDQPEAIDALDRLINFYSNSEIAPDAYLALADTFSSMVAGPDYDQGATREAISYYRDFLILFPNSDLITEGEEKLADMQDVHAQSKFIIGEYYFKRRSNYRAAEVFFNDAITVSPNSPTAQQARVYLNKIDALKPEIDIGDETLVAQEDGEPARLKLLNSENVNEKNARENEDKKLLRLGIFNKYGNSENKPTAVEEENPLTLANENLDNSKSLEDIEDPVEDLTTNEEEKTARFRLFNNKDKTENAEEKVTSKEGKKLFRLGIFNKSGNNEDKPAAVEEENPLTLADENLDTSKSLEDTEDPVEDLTTNEEEKPALFRLFNNNDKTEDTEEKLASKEGKKPLRFKLFNRSQELEDNLISPENENHLAPHNNEENN